MTQTHVWLNGTRLPIKGFVSWKRITPFPSQFSISQPQESDYTPTRKQRWSALKGGLGKDKWTPKDNDRYSEATNVDNSQELQTLGALVTTMEDSEGTGFGAEPVKIIKFNGKIWAIGHNVIKYWDGDSWEDATHGGEDYGKANPTDAIIFYGTA